jgi:hypothetical protein
MDVVLVVSVNVSFFVSLANRLQRSPSGIIHLRHRPVFGGQSDSSVRTSGPFLGRTERRDPMTVADRPRWPSLEAYPAPDSLVTILHSLTISIKLSLIHALPIPPRLSPPPTGQMEFVPARDPWAGAISNPRYFVDFIRSCSYPFPSSSAPTLPSCISRAGHLSARDDPYPAHRKVRL